MVWCGVGHATELQRYRGCAICSKHLTVIRRFVEMGKRSSIFSRRQLARNIVILQLISHPDVFVFVLILCRLFYCNTNVEVGKRVSLRGRKLKMKIQTRV